MEENRLHLTIKKKPAKQHYYPLVVENLTTEKYMLKLVIQMDRSAIYLASISGSFLGQCLISALKEAGLYERLKDFLSIPLANNDTRSILIEIMAPELYRLPWENIQETPDLAYASDPCSVIRFLSKPSQLVLKPLKLPINLLIETDKQTKILNQLPSEQSLSYFRVTQATGVLTGHLLKMLSVLKFDIVHITCRAEIRNDKTILLISGADDNVIEPKEFRSLLEKSTTRLLVLHCTDGSFRTLLGFAHSIFSSDGPSILVIRNISPPFSESFADLYMPIVHDQPLDMMLHNLPGDIEKALFIAEGGNNILRISSITDKLYSQLEKQLEYLHEAHSVLTARKEHFYTSPAKKGSLPDRRLYKKEIFSDKSGGTDDDVRTGVERQYDNERFILDNRINSLNDTINKISTQIEGRNYLDYEHESGALEPMELAHMLSVNLDKQLSDLKTFTKRVVNSWFSQNGKILKGTERLKPAESYRYEIQIGIASKKSNVKNATGLPEEELARFYSEKGIELQVELFSLDFQIEQSSQILILPPPPEESNPVSFDLITPPSDGIARMRVCIYFRQNLIQSLMVQAVIGEINTKTIIKGNIAEVDYSLSGSLLNIDQLPSRSLNIALNEASDGSHSIYIARKGLKRQFDFGEGQINNAIKNAREILQNICSTRDSKGNMSYRYNSMNQGNEKDFRGDVKKLAEMGHDLYSAILTNQERAFKDQLRGSLGNSEATIQIASTKSARYVFPWALVYDKPLITGDNDVCPQFLEDIQKGGPPGYLKSQSCIVNGCLHINDNHIICPSGFWGFKHYIEQPLSVPSDSGSGLQGLPLEIRAKGSITSVMMGVSLDLKDVEQHRKEIELLGNVDVHFMPSKNQIGEGLQRKDFHLIYFYCHGGRNNRGTWLGIGKGERISPGELANGWEVDWPFEHPLVFINGCHTADVTPDDFLHFNNTFAWCEASGVMGTEITIPERLARHFASGFLKRFLNGTSVGTSIRDQRLYMLESFNLLGLAYTPYCSSSLKIIHTH